ncbi:MAG: electron transfer flavoprotein subunit beta [Planctomycetota bacterium]
MAAGFHIVVCGSLVPDPLQPLEPVAGSGGIPALKNESMLPSILDPWAAISLYEAARLAKAVPGSKVFLASLGPKAKLQQLMMTVAQKAPFEFVAVDGPAGGFFDAAETAAALGDAIGAIPGLDRSRLLLFGGCASAGRDAGVTLGMIGERLGIPDQFLAVDVVEALPDGTLRIRERVEGGRYLVSILPAPPAVLAWSTGRNPEPPNSPQIGMANMRGILSALQKAKSAKIGAGDAAFGKVEVPSLRRQTRIVRNTPSDTIAKELADWIRGEGK